MSRQIKRADVSAWLLRNGFTEQNRVGSGHRYFTHEGSGVKVVLPGHGPKDVPKRVMSNILRQLESLGFSKERVRQELREGT